MQSKASLILKRLTNYRRFSTTWGFAILGQDVVIFIISNMAAVVRAGQTSVGFWLLSCTFVFQSAAVTGLIAMEKTNKYLALFRLLFLCYPHKVVVYLLLPLPLVPIYFLWHLEPTFHFCLLLFFCQSIA